MAAQKPGISSDSPQRGGPGVSSGAHLTLIVDNKPAISRLLKRILTAISPPIRIDMSCEEASAGHRSGQQNHALLIMDIEAPGADGCEALTEIRDVCARHRWSMPAVVFCGGTPTEERVGALVEHHAKSRRRFNTRRLRRAVGSVTSRLGFPITPRG